jgi:DNA repair ATPase RecN
MNSNAIATPNTTTNTKEDCLSKSLQELEERIKKIQQAQDFLEEIEDKLYWALDFGDCPEANAPISNIVDQISTSQNALQNSCETLEDILAEYQTKNLECQNELNHELKRQLSLTL